MNQDYIISVITPFYRGNKYIEQLFCVINKNYQKLRETFSNAKIELIIVNDSPEVEIEQPTTKVEFEYKVIKHKKKFRYSPSKSNRINLLYWRLCFVFGSR